MVLTLYLQKEPLTQRLFHFFTAQTCLDNEERIGYTALLFQVHFLCCCECSEESSMWRLVVPRFLQGEGRFGNAETG